MRVSSLSGLTAGRSPDRFSSEALVFGGEAAPYAGDGSIIEGIQVCGWGPPAQ